MVTARKPNARAEKARATRRRMREAALRLFREQGYAATPMQAIADEAGVAVQTLYFTFGTKRALLSEIFDVAIAGDEEPIATLERPHVQALMDDPDPVVQLRGQARLTRSILERLAPALEVVRGAATADPDLAELWERSIKQRATVMERFIAALAAKTPLRDGLDQATAVDIGLALQGPETYDFLVGRRGWSPEQYENWLADALISQLLGLSQLPGPQLASEPRSSQRRSARRAERGPA
jgi:AcrR family transcriptional regulator